MNETNRRSNSEGDIAKAAHDTLKQRNNSAKDDTRLEDLEAGEVSILSLASKQTPDQTRGDSSPLKFEESGQLVADVGKSAEKPPENVSSIIVVVNEKKADEKTDVSVPAPIGASNPSLNMDSFETAASSLSFVNGDFCKICHCGNEVGSPPLITPCYCTGSLKYVHQECLQKWIKAADIEKCELCKYPFCMEAKVKPFKEWEKLNLSSLERRKLLCSISFHLVAVICVAWSLYVLVERTAEEIKSGVLQWAFWTKLIVLGIGFTGGIVFMYIQCKIYVQYCRKWRAYNRIIVIRDAPVSELEKHRNEILESKLEKPDVKKDAENESKIEQANASGISVGPIPGPRVTLHAETQTSNLDIVGNVNNLSEASGLTTLVVTKSASEIVDIVESNPSSSTSTKPNNLSEASGSMTLVVAKPESEIIDIVEHNPSSSTPTKPVLNTDIGEINEHSVTPTLLDITDKTSQQSLVANPILPEENASLTQNLSEEFQSLDSVKPSDEK